MKISWGIGITISIIVFTIITLWFVYFSFSHDVNLVRDDYYEAELNFDETKETIERTSKLDQKLEIVVLETNIKISFPPEFNYKNIGGNILLYRPSDRTLDIGVNVKPDSNNTQLINKKELLSGMWRIKVEWHVDSTNYYSEKVIMVQ